jgi:8-oxo-dGTP pyrophosphatase MutT (NUDIX family)
MAHIHTLPGQHDHTISLFLFRLDFEEPRIMMHLHKKMGMYMQFGGHIELCETPWQAATHELREESGYDMSRVKLLQPKQRVRHLTDAIVHPLPLSYTTHRITNDHFHTDSSYAVITSESPTSTPGDGESKNIRLLTREELVALPTDIIFDNVREIALYIFDNILNQWEAVSPTNFSN